jgi:hypothetical protein
MTTDRQRLAKHVPELYAINNRRKAESRNLTIIDVHYYTTGIVAMELNTFP